MSISTIINNSPSLSIHSLQGEREVDWEEVRRKRRDANKRKYLPLIPCPSFLPLNNIMDILNRSDST